MNSNVAQNFQDFKENKTICINTSSDGSSSNSSDNIHSLTDGTRISSSLCPVTVNSSAVVHEQLSEREDNLSKLPCIFLEDERNWAKLPSPAVEKIYSFLSRADQSHMSLVCSRWAKEFSSPSLWQTMKFHIHENSFSPEIFPEVKFARKYAFMFRHVEIISESFRTTEIGTIWRQLNLFLEAIQSSSQLVSIKFIDMGDVFCLIDYVFPEESVKTLISFFHSQDHLKTVVFQGSHFSKEDGLGLLKAVFYSESHMISNLSLRGFVKDAPTMVISRQYMLNLSEVYGKFATVQYLELDYTEIFEDLVHYLYENLSTGEYQLDKKKPSMRILNIHCDGRRQFYFKGIKSEIWKYLKNVFPNLKVKMDVSVYGHQNREIEKFVVKEMPLQSLKLQFLDSATFAMFETSSLVRHLQICNFQDSLEVLNVSF